MILSERRVLSLGFIPELLEGGMRDLSGSCLSLPFNARLEPSFSLFIQKGCSGWGDLSCYLTSFKKPLTYL